MNTPENQAFFDQQPDEVLNRIITLDGFKTSIKEFLQVNLLGKDIEPIPIEEAQRIVDLVVGEVIIAGLCEVVRIS